MDGFRQGHNDDRSKVGGDRQTAAAMAGEIASSARTAKKTVKGWEKER